MIYIETPSKVVSPAWTDRNFKIASQISPNKSVLDLGCGSKDLLKYIRPSKYVGIDYNNKFSDIQVNFNQDFLLPSRNWDYVICSGLLEYIVNVDKFFSSISRSGKTYIITYWDKNKRLRSKNNLPVCTSDQFVKILKNHFVVDNTIRWKSHNIFVCKDQN